MRKLFTLCLLIVSLSASAQWQQTGSKVRYVNGLGIPTRDTAAGVAADSSQILIRPADSSLYIKYKRTWVKVGSGGTIGGSGTTNYIPKFTSSTAIGNSQIFDNGTNVGIGTTSPGYKLEVNGSVYGNSVIGGELRAINGSDAGSQLSLWADGSGNTNLAGFNFSINTGANGSRVQRVFVNNLGDFGINQSAPAGRFVVADGQTLLGTNTNNGVDRLQVNGSMNVSATATAQNLSATNNISVTNDINQGSGTANANYTMLANGTSSGWAGRFVAEYATGQFYFQHRNNSPTWVTCFQLNANGGKGGTSFWDNVNIRGDGVLLVNNPTDNGIDKLQVAGSILGTGFAQAYTSKTTTYTATTSDYFIDCTSGTFTVNLFTAVGNTGRILIIKNSGTGTITVDPNGSQTIDGATTQTLSTQWSRVHIISDGTNWKIISN